jgi:hypothetical protein
MPLNREQRTQAELDEEWQIEPPDPAPRNHGQRTQQEIQKGIQHPPDDWPESFPEE